MSADPIKQLPAVFGKLLTRLRQQWKLTQEAIAIAAGLSGPDIVAEMERGEREPTLSEFFRIAQALGDPPGILFIDVIAAWREDPTDRGLCKSRPSDFERLYRLGYSAYPSEFREHRTAYEGLPEATQAADKLNATRQKSGLEPFDTVCIYVRMSYFQFKRKPKAGGNEAP